MTTVEMLTTDWHGRSDRAMQFSPAPSRASVNSVASIASNYSIEELHDKIGELRKQHDLNMEEFLKVRSMHKERMAQGLEEKLAARRNRRNRKTEEEPFTPVSI